MRWVVALLLVAGVLVAPGQLCVSDADAGTRVMAPFADSAAENELPAPATAETEQPADDLCLATWLAGPRPVSVAVSSTWWLLPRPDSVPGSVAVRPPIA